MLKNDRIINANTFNLLETERNYRRHVQRLVSISQDRTSNNNQKKAIDTQTNRLQKCMNASKRVKTLQLLQVQKDNDRLLGKLLRINQGDKKSVTGSGPPLQATTARVSTEVNKSGINEPQFKSLNQVARKRDVLRIINENVRLTEKIIFQESQFAKDKMAKDYKTTREYSMRLRKLRPNDDKTVKIGHGGIVLDKDLRIKNSFKFLPPLKPEMQVYTSGNSNSVQYSRSSSVPRLPSQHTSAYDSRTVKEKFDELSRSLLAGADMTYVESLANKHQDSQRDSLGAGESFQQSQDPINQEIIDQIIVKKYLKEPENEPNEPTTNEANESLAKPELSAIIEQSEGMKSPEVENKKSKEIEEEKEQEKDKEKEKEKEKVKGKKK